MMMMTTTRKQQAARSSESGYALVSLLAVMTVMALALITAAPNLQKQKQRENELEAIARGEHLAEAIGQFINCRRRPPTSIEELVKEGCPATGNITKRRYLARPSALRDPLAPPSEDLDESNWRLVAPQSRPIVSFSRAIAEYAGGQTPRHNLFPIMQQFAPVTVQTVRGLDGDKNSDSEDDNSGLTSDYKGPFIGVASRSQRDSIITYYGIEKHSRWIFTPAYR
jgi:type II secretory pathway pseudopilin PulG